MNGVEQRKQWVDALVKIAEPVLKALSQEKLKETLPQDLNFERFDFAPLEAFGRTMCGIAPWLEADDLGGEEKELQDKFRELARIGLDKATDPSSKDFMVFDRTQALVDAAFLSHALIRAPKQLIDALDERVKTNVIAALYSSRKIVPGPNNWIFFSAMVETALYRLGAEDYDKLRIAYATRTFMDWYKGDGLYGDGATFHWDYYNSFVIQPMYVDIVKTFAPVMDEIAQIQPVVMKRAARYASILERLIGQDGTYPIIGRSICYRFGAFQLLSQASLEHFLEETVTPQQVRCALTAVISRIMSSDTLFDDDGWLRPGVFGYQPDLAEMYINRGSLYLCCSVFLPLGLSEEDPFWSGENAKWTAKKIWSGENMMLDHAIAD